jgi:hypothetical protein
MILTPNPSGQDGTPGGVAALQEQLRALTAELKAAQARELDAWERGWQRGYEQGLQRRGEI